MSKTILVVDDEPRIVSLVESYLSQFGYRVVTASNGEEALSRAQQDSPDLIVLDIMMPRMDGYEFLKQYRQVANTPVIFLTAKVEDEDRILGLEMGADDYMVKPFRPRELLARVKAVLRRSGMSAAPMELLTAKDIRVDRGARSVQIGERYLDLTPSEFDLLSVLMSQPGKVFSRLDLLEFIQGSRYEGYERTIDLHIKNLRAKLEDNSREPRYIQTVYGVGYRFMRER